MNLMLNKISKINYLCFTKYKILILLFKQYSTLPKNVFNRIQLQSYMISDINSLNWSIIPPLFA